MVFSGVPVYLDPPHWQQQDQQLGLGGAENLLLPTTAAATATAASGGLIRPPLMLERARVGTAQPPEPSLKCPRCESTNTKFCYYNNYSKTQPRHFCKTCRRYWTRGGALRNVPVGGGCRRNKRNKNNTRSSPITDRGVVAAGAAASSGGAITLPSTTGSAIQALGLDQHQNPVPPQHFPFMPTIHQFSDFTGSDLGLPFAGMHPLRSDRLGNISGGGGGGGGGGMNYSPGQSSSSQWRLQQQGQHFPIGFGQTDSMTGLEPTPSPSQGLFPFHQEGMEQQYMAGGQLRAKPPPVSDLGSIKSEENQNLPRQFLGLQSGCDQYWGSNAWADFSGFSSSTSPHL